MLLRLSDGVGFAQAIVTKEILDELWTFQNEIRHMCVIVIRGRIGRYSNEEGATAFILNEAPRLVLNDVM